MTQEELKQLATYIHDEYLVNASHEPVPENSGFISIWDAENKHCICCIANLEDFQRLLGLAHQLSESDKDHENTRWEDARSQAQKNQDRFLDTIEENMQTL